MENYFIELEVLRSNIDFTDYVRGMVMHKEFISNCDKINDNKEDVYVFATSSIVNKAVAIEMLRLSDRKNTKEYKELGEFLLGNIDHCSTDKFNCIIPYSDWDKSYKCTCCNQLVFPNK